MSYVRGIPAGGVQGFGRSPAPALKPGGTVYDFEVVLSGLGG